MRARSGLRIALASLLALGALGVPGKGVAAPTYTYTYVTMSDGVDIAISVGFPDGFDADKDYPALLQMDGYGGGGSTVNPASYGDNYVTIYASVRGTGCSGGKFDLFDRRHAMDGYEIIENWIVKQPWSNKKVGIVGYSYPALTGWMVASTNPPHLTAIGLGGLIDDLFRGIVHLGGVPNYGFPAVWTGGLRPTYEAAGNAGRWASGDPRCYQNIATRPPRDPMEDPIIRGGTELEDGPWWQYRSTITWIRGITKPIHITQHYQDEQTGPRGGWVLWEKLLPDVPKRLVATNGRHGTSVYERDDRRAWLDCWMLDDGDEEKCNERRDGIIDPDRDVQIVFETVGNSQPKPFESSDFPLPESDWKKFYLHTDATVSPAPPNTYEQTRFFVSGGRGRQAGNVNPVTASKGPDELNYTYKFAEDTTLAGPITANLSVIPTSADVDLMVTLIDVAPDGQQQYLQRGLLRASAREVDSLRSDYIKTGPLAGELYRPHRPHTQRDPLVPGTTTNLVMEVFPVGHVFRAGHSLLVKVSAPGHTDPISELYTYPQDMPPSVVFLSHSPAAPSYLLMPFLTLEDDQKQATKPACGAQTGLRCVTPAA